MTVVVLRPLGLGDFLTGVPAYRAVARAFPGSRIVLAAPRALAPLAALAGGIDVVVDAQPLAPLPGELHGADVAIDLHGRGPASHRVLLAAAPRRLIAFANPEISESAGGAPWRADEHEVVRWARMLAHAGIPCDPRDLALAVPPSDSLAGLAGATILHPGAASESRRWPAERWAQVAAAEHAAGRRVVLTGSAEEAGRAEAIAARAGLPAESVLAGRTTLLELAGLVARAGRLVSGDTGIAHLATAYRTPSVLLFGPTPPAWWGPPPERPYHRVLWRGTTGDPHGAQIDAGLLGIAADEVLEALGALDEAAADRRGAAAGAA